MEINLDKKFVPKIKITNLICFKCGSYGQHKDNCPSQPPNVSKHTEEDNVNNNSLLTSLNKIDDGGGQ